MSRGIYVALSGAVAQENALGATATNVANSSSAGFQRLRPVFRQALAQATGQDPELRYVTTSRTALDTTAGAIRTTDKPLDVALPAETYLATTSERGERYTRAGSLSVGKDGTLQTGGGAAVASDRGAPITVAAGGAPVTIDPDGTVKQGAENLGKLKLVKFEKPDALAPEGSSLLAVGGAGAMTPSTEPIVVGALEESNASPMGSMTDLMTASRTFDAFQKCLDQFSEIDRKLLTTVPAASE
jgi:flagellar basal body rod protein FlgG